MYDFKNGAELLQLCENNNILISELMRRREEELSGASKEEIEQKMDRVVEIMRESAKTPLDDPVKSMGGLIGGEAKQVFLHGQKGKSIVGNVFNLAMSYALAVLEVNASMGLIVAAPTAGSSGVVPGVLLSLSECFNKSDVELKSALFNSSAVGYLAMRNATVAGAVGGCQAEIGVATAMAASAAVELMGGAPSASLSASSIVLMNMLGLVCDPIGGLVECPCQLRNAEGAVSALCAAEIALSGVRPIIPFDEMLDTMYKVGKRMPYELRETALGGCATTPAACALCGGCEQGL